MGAGWEVDGRAPGAALRALDGDFEIRPVLINDYQPFLTNSHILIPPGWVVKKASDRGGLLPAPTSLLRRETRKGFKVPCPREAAIDI
jgi:hypothetical protein